MAVDHADGLRPENRGPVVVPGDSVTDRHAAIVLREPDTPVEGQMNFRWLTGYITPAIRRQRLGCSSAHSREPADMLWASRWITAVKCG